MTVRRYHFEELLGRGGYGSVYRARLVLPSGFEKEVAVKVLNADQASAEQVARLRDEARLLAQVRHRALPVVDGLVRLDDGRFALVMELVDGADLARIRRAGPLPSRVALQVVAEAAEALHAAFGAGPSEAPLRLVHRDVKPSNLLVTAAGDVKLLDFGIARADVSREARTATGLVLGTLSYMAPERYRGHHGAAGDVYALGCTLVALLARLPETPLGTLPREVFVREVHALAAATGEADGAPEALPELVRELLRFDPDERPAAADVALRCRALAAQADPPDLARWAPVAVAGLPRGGGADPLVGITLTESLTAPARLDPAVPRVLGVFGLAAAGLALGGGLLILGAALYSSRPGPPPADVTIDTRRVTDDFAVEWFPDLTADGRTLAYVVDGELLLRDLPDGRPRVVTDGIEPELTEVDLADDGRSAIVGFDGALHHLPIGGVPERIVEGDAGQLSPDGRRLAYVAGRAAGTPTIHVRDLASGEDRLVHDPGYQARWSTDGTELVVLSRETLVLVRANGSVARPLGIDALEPRWTPDRLWVRYLRGPFDDLRWHALERGVPRGPSHTALAGTARIVQLAAARHGRRLAWSEHRAEYRVTVYPVAPDGTLGAGRVVPVADPWAGRFALSPDGTRIAHSIHRQGGDPRGQAAVVVAGLDGHAREVEGGGVMSAIGGVQWIADGSLLVWDTSSDPGSLLASDSDYGGRTVVAIRPDGRWEPIATVDPTRYETGLVAPDGRRGAITDDELATGIVDVPAYRGAPPAPPERTAEPGWYPVHWSADGALLVVSKAGSSDLGVMDPDTLAIRTVTTGREAVLLDRERMIVHDGDGLRLVEVATGASRTLLALERVGRNGRAALSLSHDGRALLVDTTEIVGDLWVGEVR